MKKRMQHRSIAEMVRDLSSDDVTFVDHFLTDQVQSLIGIVDT